MRLEETGGGGKDTFDFTVFVLPRDSRHHLPITVTEGTLLFFTMDQNQSYLLEEKNTWACKHIDQMTDFC